LRQRVAVSRKTERAKLTLKREHASGRNKEVLMVKSALYAAIGLVAIVASRDIHDVSAL
jgi:hypothetical protein